MPITIRFLNDDRTRAEIIKTPSWLGRLFGRKTVAATVYRDRPYWKYEIDHDVVESAIDRELNSIRRWMPVSAPPEARLLNE